MKQYNFTLLAIITIGFMLISVVLSQSGSDVLHDFTGPDGSRPFIGLMQDSDGNFYGTTGSGGDFGYGTVFRINLAGAFTPLHSFNFNGVDGLAPITGVIRATDGYLYGTTDQGGTGGNNGTIFRIDSEGNNFETLFSFNGSNGRQPNRLIQASNGKFYGTARSSGAADPGTFFRMDPVGTVETLHVFSYAEGKSPSRPGLIQASDGDLYGTAADGGSNACAGGCGTVFKIDTLGNLTVLHSFNGNDGRLPNGGLIQASDGNFYGTTSAGGAFDFGTVFKMDSMGNLETKHSFNGADGREPERLLQATDGKFYVTTRLPGYGAIVVLDSDFKPTPIHTFNFNNGYDPRWLIQASDGRLYGSTLRGGSTDAGVVFKKPGDGDLGFDYPVSDSYRPTRTFGDADGWHVYNSFENPCSTCSRCYHPVHGIYHPGDDWNRDDGQDAGQVVKAVANGLVVDAKTELGTKKTGILGGGIIIQHGVAGQFAPVYSGYIHVVPEVKKGDTVVRGQRIATIFNLSSGPHLHFEIRTDLLLRNRKIDWYPNDDGCGYYDSLEKLRADWFTDPVIFIDRHRP